MNCPKCTGLLIQEEIQEHSGRFHGLRCIQCGLRLDQTIVQNQHDGNPAGRTASAGRTTPNGRATTVTNASTHRSSAAHSRPASRSKRPARAS